MIFLLVLNADFGHSVRKLIGVSGSSKQATQQQQVVPPSGSNSSGSSKLSSYFQRSSSATSSGFRRSSSTPSASLFRKQQQQQGKASLPSPPSTSTSTSVLPIDFCPSCLMPFDNNRKRRLIDSCGHERCYACLFSNDAVCPLCSPPPPGII